MVAAVVPVHSRPTSASKFAHPNLINGACSLHPKAASRFAGRRAACFFGKHEPEANIGKQPEADAPTAAAAVAAAMAAATTAEAGLLQRGFPAASETPSAIETDAYPWLQQWYPVAVSEDLQPSRPHAISLFGQPLVLWWKGGVVAGAAAAGGRWRCFRDCCPHRLAPLSEGRIDPATGQLVCSYHGWSFAGSGECTRVPQAPDGPSQAAACGSRRACATALPTTEAAGLVWVWPDSSPGAAEQAAARPPPVHPHLLQGAVGGAGEASAAGSPPAATTDGGGGSLAGADSFVNIAGGWLVREVPYGFDSMLENILDPGHAMFAHHGWLGRREDAVPFSVKLQGEISWQGGFTAALGSSSRRLQVAGRSLRFEPPCFVSQQIVPVSGAALYTCGYAVPSRPGHCLLFSTSYAVADGSALQRLLLRLLPRWALHLYTQEVLDGDLVLLHRQERNLEQAGSDWRRAYYMPTPSDGGVVAFRHWFNDLAGGAAGVPWAQGGALPPTENSKEVLLDRLHQHTERCSSCRAALTRLRAARVAGLAGAAAATATAAWLPGGDSPVSAVLAVTGVALAVLAHLLVPLFVYKDYTHAER